MSGSPSCRTRATRVPTVLAAVWTGGSWRRSPGASSALPDRHGRGGLSGVVPVALWPLAPGRPASRGQSAPSEASSTAPAPGSGLRSMPRAGRGGARHAPAVAWRQLPRPRRSACTRRPPLPATSGFAGEESGAAAGVGTQTPRRPGGGDAIAAFPVPRKRILPGEFSGGPALRPAPWPRAARVAAAPAHLDGFRAAAGQLRCVSVHRTHFV